MIIVDPLQAEQPLSSTAVTGDASTASESLPLVWFAAWTRSKHEVRVISQLRGKGIETFLPTITRWTRWKDRIRQSETVLFPGYCFARIDPTDWTPVLKCFGVVTVVSFAGRPAPIPDIEIESLRTLVTSKLRYDPCPLIHEGDRVEVTGGPLKGVAGRLIRKGPRARLVLAVDLIGRGAAVEVDAADVRAY